MGDSIVPKGFQITSHKVFSSYVSPKFALDPIRTTPTSSEVLVPPDCSVCLCALQEPTTLVQCEHVFCFDCIRYWFKKDNRCPLCKQRTSAFVRTTSSGSKELWSNPTARKSKEKSKRSELIENSDSADSTNRHPQLRRKRKRKHS